MGTLQQDSGTGVGPIERDEVRILGAERAARLTDPAALKLVRQDVQNAEAFIAQKQWALQWMESDILYQSPRSVSAWENGTTTRANVSRFTVAKQTNTLVEDMKSGIFYEDPPFVLRPRPGTHQSTVRAKTAMISAMMEKMDFQGEAEEGIESQVLNGTGIWEYGDYVERKVEKKFRRKHAPVQVQSPFGGQREIPTQESDEFEVVEQEIERWGMFFEHVPLTELLIDPGWRKANNPNKAKYIIRVHYVTFNDLDKLRDRAGYEIPSRDELAELFFHPVEQAVGATILEKQDTGNVMVHHAAGRDEKTTEDPLQQPLRLDERWDGERVLSVLQDKLVIRNFEHGYGRRPFLSANFWNIQRAGYGLGVGRLVGQDQRVDQGVMNAALDILSMAVNPQYARSRGANVPTQQIRQRLGGIVDVDGKVDEAFKLIESPKVPPEAFQVLAASKQTSESTTGADEAFGQGTLPNRGMSTAARTATGAGGIISARARRIQGPVGRFCKFVLVPFIRIMDEMICERMPMSQIREILGEELGEDFTLDADNFLNGAVKYEVLAGVHIAAKKAMAQALPFMVATLENPELLKQLTATGWVVDIKEFFAMVQEMSEWKNTRDLIRPMNPQEKQQYMMVNQAVQKIQGQQALLQQKQQGDKELAEQKTEGRMAERILESSIDRATAYDTRETVRNLERGQFYA